jgi:hypothetical protein
VGLCELAAQVCEAPLDAIELVDAGRWYTVAAYGVHRVQNGAEEHPEEA